MSAREINRAKRPGARLQRSLTKVPRRERLVNVKKCSQASERLESVSSPSHLSCRLLSPYNRRGEKIYDDIQ
jgi:hypothetical protein